MHRLYTLYSLTCILFFSCALSTASAQQDTTQQIKNDASCQQITEASLSRLTNLLNSNDFSGMAPVLQTIESACGPNEVTQRLRIMGQLIQKMPTKGSIQSYIQQGRDNELMLRLDNAAENNYQNIYRKNPAQFHHVPLRHAIDSLVQVKAAALLNSDSYTLTEMEEAIAYLFSDHISTYLIRMQKEKPTTRTERLGEVELYKQGWGFTINGGLYRPLNATNPVFNNQAIFGISFMSPLSNDWIFDGYLKFRSNQGSRDFEYELYNEVEIVNSPASYMLGASLGYKFLDMGKFLMVGKGGIGWETVSTGLSETVFFDYYDQWGNNASTRFHNVNTLNLSAGLSAMQHLHRRTFIGGTIQYNYSPYNNDRRLLTPITPNYVSFEVFFRF